MLSAISGGNATFDNMASLDADAAAKKTAEDFRTNAGNEIIIRLGGLDWTPTYLSKTADAQNIILTLWMTNSEQEAFQGLESFSEKIGKFHGFVKGPETGQTGLYSDWAADWAIDDATDSHPSAMYGTSYIRAVTLNNGG